MNLLTISNLEETEEEEEFEEESDKISTGSQQMDKDVQKNTVNSVIALSEKKRVSVVIEDTTS